MEQGTKNNSKAWEKVYESTNFGNQYPTDGLVSLYHHFMKERLSNLPHPIKVLDFACSHGANAKFFRDLGFEVYGIDISEEAIAYCVKEQGFEAEKFIACNVLQKDLSLKELFGKFDLIIASECLYYFSDQDLQRLIKKFYDCMNKGAVIYTNMHTWNHQLYRDYKDIKPNNEGLIEVKASGKADLPLWVKIVEDKREMRNLFGSFVEIGRAHV